MRIVIVGGGKVGGYLARQLGKAGHSVVVIEKNAEKAEKVSNESDVLCLVGDGTEVSMLRRAEAGRADFVLALTGRDEDNLVACQLAKVAFDTPRVLARLNDPRNHPTFDALEVPVVGFTDLVAKVISRELDVGDLVRIAILERGTISLIEIEIPDDLPPRRVADLELPSPSNLVTIQRDGEMLIPRGETLIVGGDKVLAVCPVEAEDRLRDAMITGPSPSTAGDEPGAGREG